MNNPMSNTPAQNVHKWIVNMGITVQKQLNIDPSLGIVKCERCLCPTVGHGLPCHHCKYSPGKDCVSGLEKTIYRQGYLHWLYAYVGGVCASNSTHIYNIAHKVIAERYLNYMDEDYWFENKLNKLRSYMRYERPDLKTNVFELWTVISDWGVGVHNDMGPELFVALDVAYQLGKLPTTGISAHEVSVGLPHRYASNIANVIPTNILTDAIMGLINDIDRSTFHMNGTHRDLIDAIFDTTNYQPIANAFYWDHRDTD